MFDLDRNGIILAGAKAGVSPQALLIAFKNYSRRMTNGYFYSLT